MSGSSGMRAVRDSQNLQRSTLELPSGHRGARGVRLHRSVRGHLRADLHDFRDALRQARMRGHDLRAAHPEVILLDALLRELRRVDRLVQLLAGCEREQSRNGTVGLTTRAK